jgi:sugar lactone lactonase YvrE
MTDKPKTVLDGLAFPECPRWHEDALWFSDMHAHEVVRLDADGTRRTMASFDGPISGLGWLADGRMLVVSMADKTLLKQQADGSFVTHGDMSNVATGLCNDMVIDAQGNAFVGNFGFSLHPPEDPKPAKLARVTPDGAVSAAAEDLMFPNGAVITPDGKTLIVGESFAAQLTAFDLAADGTLSNRRVWAALPKGAVPDGSCLDAEGAVWTASPTSSEVIRLKEGGEVLARIPTEQLAIACMLGGDDRKTLYILTAESTDPDVCKAKRNARIQTIRVNVAGAGRP